MSISSFWRGLASSAASLPVILTRTDPDGLLLSLALPANAEGAWCRLRVTVTAPGPFWIKLEMEDDGEHTIVRQRFLGPARRRHDGAWRETLVYVPRATRGMAIKLFGAGIQVDSVRLDVLTRLAAALRLLRQGWTCLPGAVRGDPMGLPGRIRTVLGQEPARRGEAPPYHVWLGLYGRDVTPAPHVAEWDFCPIQVVVIEAAAGSASPAGPSEAMSASLASVASQTLRAANVITVYRESDWAKCAPGMTALLQAGEILAKPALAWLARKAMDHPGALAICADLDEIDARGARHSPHFKPAPDPLLLRSGLLTRGAMLFRNFDPAGQAALHAGEARLSLSLACGALNIVHVPAILTHQGWNTASPDPVRLARLAPDRPMHRAAPRGKTGKALVSMIVPSTGRSPHVLRCLRRVIRATRYANFEILLAVTRVDPRDRRQSAILRQARALPHTTVLDLGMEKFNYAAANNVAAQSANGSLLLLLNDDVAPISNLWLDHLVEHLDDPGVGIVGARLLYGNDTVQHGGVLLGLAGLCEHIDRTRAAAWHGPFGMARRDRSVSAVTAACMLVRRVLFEELRGLDTQFAIALNDVDFCLRAGAAGQRTVYAPGAVLHHYESLSLGRHYAGDRAVLEHAEISLLQRRWAGAIASDPWYNPQASLEPGREWQPAFPPRASAGNPMRRSDADHA